VLAHLDSPGAFKEIPEAIELILEETDEYPCFELLGLLRDLAYKSDTTEIHPALAESWDRLALHLTNFQEQTRNQLVELKKWWYRVQ